MPRGVTPTRVRRRQSDAKWRASVAMCYNIMKNVIPNQKKLGRRKVSKALTLKETERHIANLERKLRELIEERAPMCGKAILIEREDSCLTPATFDDVKQDFATKQHALFMCTTTGGKKRYNVPSDIEASLEQLSQQSCDLVAMDHKELETSFPNLIKMMDTPRFKPQVPSESTASTLQSLLNTQIEETTNSGVSDVYKTPAKKSSTSILSEEVGTNSKIANDLRSNSLKVCKQLPFSHQSPLSHTTTKRKPVSLLTGRSFVQPSLHTLNMSTQTCLNSPPPYVRDQSVSQIVRSPDNVSISPFLKSSGEDLKLYSSSRKFVRSKDKCSDTSGQVPSGFTPVKLPFSLNSEDPMLAFSGTSAEATIGSPLACWSIPETPGSCFTNVDYLELTDDEDVASLLCTETIDSIDLDKTVSILPSVDREANEREDSSCTRCKTSEDRNERSGTQTKVRRRLDRDYGSSEDQAVPNTEKSCLEFDGYLLFHKHNAALMDPGCGSSDKALTIAEMWENLEPEDRARYARIASLDQSDDSFDLSADLLGIDLKPLHKEHAEVRSVFDEGGSQEVPNLVLDLSEEIHTNYQLQYIEGFEDLGVFYPNDDMKEDFSQDFGDRLEDSDQMNQLVPQM